MFQMFRVNKARMVNAQGSFFRYERLISTNGSEAIKLRADGQDLGELLPGDAIRLPVFAVEWEITGLASNIVADIRIGVGEVESSRVYGDMQIIDAFGEGITTASAVSTDISVYTSTALVAPTANKMGMIVRAVAISTQSAPTGTSYIGVIAAKTAPTDFATPAQKFNFLGASDNTNKLIDKLQHFNKRVPAGWGIYSASMVTGAIAVNNSSQIQYELIV